MNDKTIMTVSDYCKKYGTSSQAVYAKIKRNTIDHKLINGVKHIVVNDDTNGNTNKNTNKSTNADTNSDTNELNKILKSIIKDQKKDIKRLHRRVQQLEDQTMKDMKLIGSILVGDTKPVQISAKPVEEVIDAVVEDKKKKSKKKSKKQKRNKR